MFAMLALAVVKRLLSIVIRPRAAGGRPPHRAPRRHSVDSSPEDIPRSG